MDPTTIRLPETTLDELDSEYSDYGYSARSDYIRDIIEHRDPPFETTQTTSDYAQPTTDDYERLRARVDELEDRLTELETHDATERRERNETATDDNAVVTTAKSDEQNVAPNTRRDVETSDVLEGWTHGRSESERDASRRVALDATEWLRDHGGRVTKSDVPLDELADTDPLDRSPETLWTEVVRDAWTHAVERGVVKQPTARSYRWRETDA